MNADEAKEIVDGVIAGLGDFKTNVESVLQTLPEALIYQTYDRTTQQGTGECGPVKLGLKFTKK